MRSYFKHPIFLEYRNESKKIYFILIALFSVGMLVTSPQSSGPDEPMNQASGWYSIRNGLNPSYPSTIVSDVPTNLVTGPCFAFKPNVTSECLSKNPTTNGKTDFPVFNYPPVYFWIIGLGQISFGIVDQELSYLGGRLFGLFAILGLLLISIVKLSRMGLKRSSEMLFIALTPMSYFVFSTANPSGWEIATSILFFTTLTVELKKRTIEISSRSNSFQNRFLCPNLPILLTGLLLVFSRPLGFVWLILIVGIVGINLGLLDKIFSFKSVISSIGLTQIPAFLWFVTHPENSELPGLKNASAGSIIDALPENILHSVFSLHEKYKQSWGVLGWLDTRPPNTVYVLVAFLFSLLTFKLMQNNRTNWKVFLFTAIFLNLIIIALESYKWIVWPNWWQGRYGLPLLVCSLLSLLMNGNQINKIKNLNLLIIFIITGNAFMIYLNFYRYTFGLWNSVSIKTLISGVDFSITLFTFVVLILIVAFLKKIYVKKSKAL